MPIDYNLHHQQIRYTYLYTVCKFWVPKTSMTVTKSSITDMTMRHVKWERSWVSSVHLTLVSLKLCDSENTHLSCTINSSYDRFLMVPVLREVTLRYTCTSLLLVTMYMQHVTCVHQIQHNSFKLIIWTILTVLVSNGASNKIYHTSAIKLNKYWYVGDSSIFIKLIL